MKRHYIIDYLLDIMNNRKETGSLEDESMHEYINFVHSKLDIIDTDLVELKKKTWKNIQKEVKKNKRLVIIKTASYWVAASLIPILLCVFLCQKSNIVDGDCVENKTDIFLSHGEQKSVLLFANGEKINLNKVADGELINDKRIAIVKRNNTISYLDEKKNISKKVKYNRIFVPKGGEYRIVLSDGTKVWLNSDTELRFPEIFNSEERLVYLRGEAYFEVSKDSKHPFRVKFNKGNVKVIGTSFCVTAYEDEDKVSAVLKEGSVSFSSETNKGHQSIVLVPGNKVVCNGQMRLSNVNIDKELAWLSGNFYFEDMRLEDILIKLSKWYDFDFFFRNSGVDDFVFTGMASRYDSLNNILKKIQMTTNVKFLKGRGNVIIVE